MEETTITIKVDGKRVSIDTELSEPEVIFWFRMIEHMIASNVLSVSEEEPV